MTNEAFSVLSWASMLARRILTSELARASRFTGFALHIYLLAGRIIAFRAPRVGRGEHISS